MVEHTHTLTLETLEFWRNTPVPHSSLEFPQYSTFRGDESRRAAYVDWFLSKTEYTHPLCLVFFVALVTNGAVSIYAGMEHLCVLFNSLSLSKSCYSVVVPAQRREHLPRLKISRILTQDTLYLIS